MPYADLTKAEQAHWNEYGNLRGISDWPGFTPDQDIRKRDARHWLVERRKEIWRLAQPKAQGGDGRGWAVADRRRRWEFLKAENLDVSAPKHEVRLPCPSHATDLEAVMIEEREVYLAIASSTPEQRARKLANTGWLVDRRKRLWALLKDEPNDSMVKSRKARYDALCIATGHGAQYREWTKSHNKWGVPLRPSGGIGTEDFRTDIAAWCRQFLGVNESPPGSNRGRPQPSGWQTRVYGSDGVPWCACFTTCSAWDNGVRGTATASVALNVSLARRGQGMYRGYTTDPSRVRPGDHAVIGSTTSHIGTVVGPTAYDTIEGNTSPGSEGSQYNGGCVARRQRHGAIVGWCLIRDPA